MSEELELQTPYLRLAARAWGPPNGVPVLALHGWLDNAASFDALAPLLPNTRLVALDLTGHGRSEHRPPGIHYHFVDFIPDVVAAADALGWDRFALLGHSLGGGIASFVAATLPERIDRVAMIEGLGPPTSDPADGPANLRKTIQQMDALPHKRPPVYANLEAAIQARCEASGLSWVAATILVERGVRLVDGGFGWRTDPRLRFVSPLYLSEPQILAYMERIVAPALLICGADGYLVKRAYMQERYARIADLTVKILPGGHHPHLEDPEPCAHLLAPFFTAV
ncbi:alpha/beta hydrolase [Candidatus Competibacter phosphatis]|uniref:Alpha/beta hydrolase n=1 Tax=Candidatus Competibacter phosphatis TaxID=221280 RepID=A0ABX1TJA2_9GAMM|nr:alpha/beta hydrolase [Candidatus Competibacter phosphatis]NMQ18066.1 alpha/beta hydrolase [Candidatus Competibacter phosphatis]